MTENIIIFIIALMIVVAFIVSLPLALIWSLNTLFGLGIAYTLNTWGAGLFILWVLRRINPKIVSTNQVKKVS